MLSAKERCRAGGILFTEMEYQIVPCEANDPAMLLKRPSKIIVRELRPVLGSMPYDFQAAPRKC
jgi:hypothetical protein